MSELTPTMRRDITQLIEVKAKNAVQGLEREVSLNRDTMLRDALKEHGYTRTSDELFYERRDLERRLREIEFDEDEEFIELEHEKDAIGEQIDVEAQALRTDAEQRIQVIRRQLEISISALNDRRREMEVDVDNRIEARQKAILDDQAPGDADRLEQVKEEQTVVKLLERQLENELDARIEALEKSRNRLIHLVHDAAATARTKLLQCQTTEQAYDLLNVIPSVAEMIHLAEDPEGGLQALVNRLMPSHAIQIEAPKPKPIEDEPVQVAGQAEARSAQRTIEVVRVEE